MWRDAHIFQAQAFKSFEAKDVANDAGGQVRNRSLLEQIEIISNVCNILICPRNWNDLVGFGLVVLICRQTIGPDYGPGSGGRLASDSRGGFNRIYTLLWHNAERAQDVCVFRFIVGLPVAHLGIGDHP